MRLASITTALLVTVASIAAAGGLATACVARGGSGFASTASFRLKAGRGAIAVHAAIEPAEVEVGGIALTLPASGHVAIGGAIPEIGWRAMHSMQFSGARRSPYDRRPAVDMVDTLGGARVRLRVDWSGES